MRVYEEDIKKLNLWEKISQVSNEVEYLQKDDKVGFGSNQYKAISIEKVVSSVNASMVNYGIVIYPVEQEYKRQDEEVTKKDGSVGINRISDVNVKYEVVNIHNPSEKIIVVSSGCGVDTQDKGIGKAMTYAYKNMIIKLFNIATGDDSDKIHSDDYTNKLMGTGGTTKAQDKPQGIDNTKVKLLLKKALEKGYNEAKVLEICKKKYSVNAIKDINVNQFKTMIEGFEKLEAKEG